MKMNRELPEISMAGEREGSSHHMGITILVLYTTIIAKC